MTNANANANANAAKPSSSSSSASSSSSSSGSTGYHVGRPTGQCWLTGATIEPGEEFTATLCEATVEEEGGAESRTVLQRRDISRTVWEEGGRPERLVFYWRSTMPDADSDGRDFVDDEVLMNLFERLEDDPDPQRVAYRFVLGLMLMRKKLLRCVSTEVRDGRSVWHMKRKGDPPETPTIEMIDPQLEDDRVREVADQLGEVFREDS